MPETTTQIVALIIILCSFFMLLLSIFIISIIIIYKKKQIVYSNEISLLKTETENAILKAQLEIQEQTFQNISRDIHDNVGQKLSLAKLKINNLGVNNHLDISDTTKLIGSAITDLRNLSRMLSADFISEMGLVEVIKFEVQQLSKLNFFEINFQILGEIVFLETNAELVIFRIVQEGLQNIVKHADAQHVNIELRFCANEVSILINDDGMGLKVGFEEGQGLKNIKARTKFIGGVCKLIYLEPHGTSLEIRIPTKKNNE